MAAIAFARSALDSRSSMRSQPPPRFTLEPDCCFHTPPLRWAAFSQFLDDGRICLTNNAAERALRGIALGRKAWLFAGSDRGGERAAAMYSLIVTAYPSGDHHGGDRRVRWPRGV